MRIGDLIGESLADWDTGVWVHFADTPYLKLNPKPSHQDPVGLYFFPERFEPWAVWVEKPYKIIARLTPGARVLDMAKASVEIGWKLAELAGVTESLRAYVKEYPPEDTVKFWRMTWEEVRRAFMVRQGASFNKALRTLGYDAVFDDAKVIHSNEVQLLVLDPRVIKVISAAPQKHEVFAKAQRVLRDITELAQPYGQVTTTSFKKTRNRYDQTLTTVEARVEITNPVEPEENYMTIRVMFEVGEKVKPIIQAHVMYSRPSLGYGSGATYHAGRDEYQHGGLDDLKRSLEKTFPVRT